jgi:hypothetical protein
MERMRKVDAGWAILAGLVLSGLALFTPVSRVLPRELLAWQAAIALLAAGWLIGRYRPGTIPRLITSVGLAWVSFLVFVAGAYITLLILILVTGTRLGP